MSAWRTFLAALFATPSLPIHREIEEAVRSRGEVRRFAARVHREAQTSALDIIDSQEGTAPAMDAVEAMLRGRPKD